jgi:ABC-2 type transport system ATP-binding protein
MPSTIAFTLPPGMTSADLPAPLRGRGLDDARRTGGVTLESSSPLGDLAELATWARERELSLNDLQVTRPSLEDVYLDLVEDQKR